MITKPLSQYVKKLAPFQVGQVIWGRYAVHAKYRVELIEKRNLLSGREYWYMHVTHIDSGILYDAQNAADYLERHKFTGELP